MSFKLVYYITFLDLHSLNILMFSHVNKKFHNQSKSLNLRNIKFLLNSNKNILSVNATYEGYLNILIYLSQIKKLNIDSNVCIVAAKEGHLNILNWISQNYNKNIWEKSMCICAAINGKLEMLKWFCNKGYEWDHLTCEYAIKYNHYELFKWFARKWCTM